MNLINVIRFMKSIKYYKAPNRRFCSSLVVVVVVVVVVVMGAGDKGWSWKVSLRK